MSGSQQASYYDLIPPDAKQPLRLMKLAEQRALIAVSKDTCALDRLAAKRKVETAVKGARKALKKLGGPILELNPTVREVLQRAIEGAEKTASAPAPVTAKKKTKSHGKRTSEKRQNERKAIADKFKLPQDVVKPITGTEDIAYKYRVHREPPDPTYSAVPKLSKWRPRTKAKGPYTQEKRAMDGEIASDLADDLQSAAIRGDNEPGPRDASSSRVPYSYTVNCLAADLQLSSLGLTSTSVSETRSETSTGAERLTEE